MINQNNLVAEKNIHTSIYVYWSLPLEPEEVEQLVAQVQDGYLHSVGGQLFLMREGFLAFMFFTFKY